MYVAINGRRLPAMPRQGFSAPRLEFWSPGNPPIWEPDGLAEGWADPGARFLDEGRTVETVAGPTARSSPSTNGSVALPDVAARNPLEELIHRLSDSVPAHRGCVQQSSRDERDDVWNKTTIVVQGR